MIQPALELPRTNTIIFAILDFLQIHKNYIKFWGLTSIFTRTFAGGADMRQPVCHKGLQHCARVTTVCICYGMQSNRGR